MFYISSYQYSPSSLGIIPFLIIILDQLLFFVHKD